MSPKLHDRHFVHSLPEHEHKTKVSLKCSPCFISSLYIHTPIHIYCCANMWYRNICSHIILLKYSHCDLSRWLHDSEACVGVLQLHSLSRAEGVSMPINKLSPRTNHWTFLLVMSPFCDWTSSFRRF